MDDSQKGQVTKSAAEVYEEFFIPALFQEWTGRLLDAARVQDGQHLLDVACGTGVLARAAEERAGPTGSVTGIDINEGMLAVAVWDSLENTPGYAAMAGLLLRLFGEKAAESLQAPFNLGDKPVLRSLFDSAGLRDVKVTTHTGTARFSSIRAWVFTEIKGWTLSGMIDEVQYQQLLSEAEKEFQRFVSTEGTVEFPAPGHIVKAFKK